MNLTTLESFRQQVHACFQRAADALFNTVDALLTETAARSFAELCLSPFFQRRWSSLYEACEDGRIEQGPLQRVFVTHMPLPAAGNRLVLGLDVTTIARPESVTAADRTKILVHNLPDCKDPPVTAGWQFSTLMVLPEQPSSWCYLLDSRRIASSQTAGEVAGQQLAQIMALLPEGVRPVLTADRAYPSIPFLRATADLACDKLLRLKSNRVFYRPAPPPTGKRGAPRKEGERFQCCNPSTHGEPSQHWDGQDANGRRIAVDCWEHLHLRQARDIEVSVIRVTRWGATDKKRDPRVSWFLWVGRPLWPLEQVWSSYQRRYSMEHCYRFQKQSLLWEEPRLRTPDQFERWTQVVAIVHNHLVLARPLVEAIRQPWARNRRLATPQQVRRGMDRFLVTLGTPAEPPQPRGKSPGRQAGAQVRPAPRFAVSKKTKPTPKKQRKRA